MCRVVFSFCFRRSVFFDDSFGALFLIDIAGSYALAPQYSLLFTDGAAFVGVFFLGFVCVYIYGRYYWTPLYEPR